MAYATRQCDSTGRCTASIVVQDVAGAGTDTVLRGALNLRQIRWVPDGRHLVFSGSFGQAGSGAFSMPSLGGAPRYLGCCTISMGGGDTVLVTASSRGSDTVAWVRWITAPDGVVRDSLAMGLGHARLGRVDELSGRRGLVAAFVREQSITFVTMLRSGRVTDSVLFRSPNAPRLGFVTPDREKLGLWFPHPGKSQEYDLVLYPVDAVGRFGKPDTVYRQLTITTTGDHNAGVEVYDYGISEYSVWALARDGPISMKWSQRRLAMATERMLGIVSNAGDRVLLGRSTAAAPGRIQLSVMPFDSGPEVPLGAAEELVDWGWSQDDKGVVIAARRDTDSIAILQLDLATGRSAPLAGLRGSDFAAIEMVPGGGLLVLLAGEVRRIGVPGLPDSTFPLGGDALFINASPDGRAFVAVGWNPTYDTVLVHRISVVDGSATKVASMLATRMRRPRWLADGSVIVPVLETAWTMAWYRVPSAGGAAVRLGSPPRFPAEYDISADGRRAVAVVEDLRTDIYMIRNFGSVLK